MIEKVQTGLIWSFLILFLYFVISDIWEVKTTKDSVKMTKDQIEMKDSTLRTVKEWVNQNKKDKEEYKNQITILQESLKKKNQTKSVKLVQEEYNVMNAQVSPKVMVKDTVVYNYVYKDSMIYVYDTIVDNFEFQNHTSLSSVGEVIISDGSKKETSSKPKKVRKKNRKENP